MPRLLPAPLLLLASLWSGDAAAHPEAADAWGHKLEVDVLPGQVAVRLTVEAPVLRASALVSEAIRAAAPAPAEQVMASFDEDFRAGLLQDLRVEVDGEPVEMTPMPAAPLEAPDRRFVAWRVASVADIPDRPAEVRVVHAAWPGERAVFYSAVQVSDEVVLSDSNLVDLRGDVVRNRDSQWRPDPALREVRLRTERRPPPGSTAHRAWRWLTTPAATWTDLAPEIEVVEGARPGLRRLMSSAPDRRWRASLAALSLGLGGGLLPWSLTAVAGVAVRRRQALVFGLAVFVLGALQQLVAVSAWAGAALHAGVALALATTAALVARDRPAAWAATLAIALTPLPVVAEAAPLAAALGDPLLVAGLVLSAGAGLGGAALVAAAAPLDRIPSGLRAVVLVVVAGLHVVLAVSGGH